MALSPDQAGPIPRGEMVCIVVSGTQEKFHIHANLLIHYSAYFATLFEIETAEALSKSFNLESLADNISMEIYTDWIYARNHLGESPDIFDDRTLEQLIKSWVLGRHLETPKFKNDVMRAVYDRSLMELTEEGNEEVAELVVQGINDYEIKYTGMHEFLVKLTAYCLSSHTLDHEYCREILGKLSVEDTYQVVMSIVDYFTTRTADDLQGDYKYEFIGPVCNFLVEE
ncbi:hypothetical protein F4775DRAFT_593923 [Biscogniauxia sp. FL1348]|nr:hypothetical protein F4775DRAFT_593923 [Biscogniauxia sp. FL1348]